MMKQPKKSLHIKSLHYLTSDRNQSHVNRFGIDGVQSRGGLLSAYVGIDGEETWEQIERPATVAATETALAVESTESILDKIIDTYKLTYIEYILYALWIASYYYQGSQ